MNKLFSIFVIFIIIVLPSIGFCDISIVDNIEDQLFLTDNTVVLDNSHMLYTRQASEPTRPNNPARPSDNKATNDEDEESVVLNTHANAHQNNNSNVARPSTNKAQTANRPQQHSNNYSRPQQYNNYRHSPSVYHTHYESTYRRPMYVTQPRTEIIVVEQSPTYYESTSHNTVSKTISVKDYIGSRFGFGFRIIGNKVSDYYFLNGEIESTGTSPGFGWYIKYRPIRWISLEIVNDFIFTENNLGDTYVRIPLYFGIHTHLFDYGQLDLYAITNIGVSFIQLYNDEYYDDAKYFQWGGQFGIGISVLLSVIEMGVDVRYMLESAPSDHYCYHDYHDYDKSKLAHGILFGFNIGFGI